MIARRGTRLARRLALLGRDERGMTIVEAVVAAMLLVFGALSVLQVFDTATRNTFRIEQSQVLVNRLQAELETLRNLEYADLAMSSVPANVADQNDPRWRVSGSEYAISRSGANLRPMVVNTEGDSTPGTGAVDPGPVPFTTGDISGQIFRFIVTTPDPGCPAAPCEDLRRAIVAARIDDAPISVERTFQEVQSDVIDPEAGAADDPNPPPGDPGSNVGQLWLTDTSCDHSSRQEIVVVGETDGHPSHNTRGVCADGVSMTETPGAPDLIFTDAPEIDPDYPPDGQPLYDYATDVEPTENPDQDKGLLLKSGGQEGCLLEGEKLDMPAGETEKHLKLHKWLSAPVPSGPDLGLAGGATLQLWTRTLNGASHEGRICIYVFIREPNLLGESVDTPLHNTADPQQPIYTKFSRATWPTNWEGVEIPLEYVATDLQPGDRLGLAVTVEKNGTLPGQGLELMYDHPSFESRLEVKIDGQLPF